MLRRPYRVIALSLVFVVTAAACGRGDRADEAAPPTPTATARSIPVPVSIGATVTPLARLATPTPTPTAKPTLAPTPTATAAPTVVPTPTPTLTPPPSPTPVAALNGGDASADEVSLTNGVEELYTVEVVKILKPSIVQVVTDILAMGFSNQPAPSKGVGTGIILDEQGNILTNNHVIDGAQSIAVTLSNGDSFPAELIGGDFSTDLAIIRIQADGLSPAQLGLSSKLQVGQDVIAIGHALGLEGGPTVSKGVVSALGRSIDTDAQTTIVDLIQTDASINPGNSGGALVNSSAEVVGINTAIIQGSQGIGFAINIDDAKVVVAQLIEIGYVDRGFLGITPVNVTAGLADRMELSISEGVLVARVIPGTAADEAGLSEGDVIVQLGDEPISNNGELGKFLIAHPPGETVELVYFRRGTKISTEITLRQRPQP